MNFSDNARVGYYAGGSDGYNFQLEIMQDSEDLFQLVYLGKQTDDEIGNGAILLITEKQFILSFNRGMGQGSHNNAIARAWADINGRGPLNFRDVVIIRDEIERKLLTAKIFSEREAYNKPLKNMIVFSFNRGDKISKAEFDSFMNFYNEYAWVISLENFEVWFGGKKISLEQVMLLLENMIDPNLDLSEIMPKNEKIIGNPTEEKRLKDR